MLKDKYKNCNHLIYILNLLFYLRGIHFISDLSDDLLNIGNDNSTAQKMTIDILEYGLNSKKIFIINRNKIYNELNSKELFEIINRDWEKFTNIANEVQVRYDFEIGFTDYWKKELAKVRLLG